MDANSVASLTTAAGTLVLAVATFGSTRTANRASRIAERSLLAALRPVIMQGQLGDPQQKIGYADQHWVHVEGPGAVFEELNDNIYLACGVRNVGSGIAVLQAWHPSPERFLGTQTPAAVEEFRPQTRSLYIAPGGLGFWQGALRDPSEPVYQGFAEAARNRTPVTIDVLYTDMTGGQRTITRISIMPMQADHWVASVSRHWMLDGLSPAMHPDDRGNRKGWWHGTRRG